MSYELINEELKIYSCSISDLTFKQINIFLKQWEDESSIGSLTVFYDNYNDRIVLNREHKCFERFSIIACDYIEQPEARTKIKSISNSTAHKWLIDVLDEALCNRKSTETKGLLKKQILPNNWSLIMDELDNLYDYENPSLSRLGIYTYGYIQGKRAERAKKKHKCGVIA